MQPTLDILRTNYPEYSFFLEPLFGASTVKAIQVDLSGYDKDKGFKSIGDIVNVPGFDEKDHIYAAYAFVNNVSKLVLMPYGSSANVVDLVLDKNRKIQRLELKISPGVKDLLHPRTELPDVHMIYEKVFFGVDEALRRDIPLYFSLNSKSPHFNGSMRITV